MPSMSLTLHQNLSAIRFEDFPLSKGSYSRTISIGSSKRRLSPVGYADSRAGTNSPNLGFTDRLEFSGNDETPYGGVPISFFRFFLIPVSSSNVTVPITTIAAAVRKDIL